MPPHVKTLPNPEAARQLGQWLTLHGVLDEVAQERLAQMEQWTEQESGPPLPLGFGAMHLQRAADMLRQECDEANQRGELTHRHILLEEFYEALAEGDPAKARDELIQVAACCIKAIQDIDRAAAHV